jgi:hypothetical protein
MMQVIDYVTEDMNDRWLMIHEGNGMIIFFYNGVEIARKHIKDFNAVKP